MAAAGLIERPPESYISKMDIDQNSLPEAILGK